MEDLLARSGKKIHSLKRGQGVKVKLLSIEGNKASFEVGGKSEGIVSDANFIEAKNYIKTLKPGDIVKAVVIEPENSEGVAILSLRHATQENFWSRLKKAQKEGKAVDVIGKSVASKGIMVELDSISAFIPTSQLSAKAAKNPEDLVDKRFKVKIIEADQDKNRIVLSERAISEAADIEKISSALKKVKVGEIYDGVVTTITSFGIFVELKIDKTAVEGLVHVSELSWGKIDDPSSLYSEGDAVKVSVLSKDDGKLSLSIKEGEVDPWKDLADRYKVDQKVSGKVMRTSSYGAFVELEEGVEGLIHITKIPPGTKLEEGSSVNCYIEDINARDRKISLGLVVTTSKPVGYR